MRFYRSRTGSMQSSTDDNPRGAMVVSDMFNCNMREDIEEAVRELLEADRGISEAVRDACFRPESDSFVRHSHS